MDMPALLCGVGAFVLFGLDDWCTIRRPASVFLRWGFSAGCLLVLISTLRTALLCLPLRPQLLGWWAAALAFAFLLAQALFFSLPKGTYSDPAARRRVWDQKMYALCRHPGFLWFAGLYFCLGGALGPASWGCFLMLCLLNLAYVILQDLWTFPRTFCDYGEYRRRVPFLLPTPGSLKNCLRQYAGRKEE